MSKKVMMIGLLGIGLVAMLGAKAEAHYIVSAGQLLYHSLECRVDLRGVQNPATNPAVSVCTVTVTSAELLCENPQNHDVRPGRAGTRTRLVGSDQIDQSDITGKGRARVSIIIPDDDLLNPEFCVNPNWRPVEVLVREARVKIDTYECLDAGCTQRGVQASTTEFDCVLPPEFDFDNLPEQGEPYMCDSPGSKHMK